LAMAAHSFEFADINAVALRHPSTLTGALTLGPVGAPYLIIPTLSLATAATLCLFLGCTGKSAQIPLFVWLPDAMAGPTPVSALIHAATMVTSGVYLVCRLSPVFALAPVTMATMAVTGTVTALLAASVGLVQNDIKKVLAYSTVSQLGFMFAAVGCGAFAAGIMHVYTHAFFKACLFLGAGSVMHAVGAHGDADIRTLGGLRKFMPLTRWTFLLSCLAIAGVPFFSGFFSKDEILVGALSVNGYFAFAPWLGKAVFAGLVVAATMTAFYMFRLYFLTFSGEYRGGPAHEGEAHATVDAHARDDAHAHDDAHDHAHDHAHAHGHDPHESPTAMTLPLVVLAFGAVFAGYVWVGIAHFEPWVVWLEPALGSIGVEHASSAPVVAMAFGLFAAGFGIGLAYLFYFRGSDVPARMAASLPGLHRLLMDKWRIDELYDATILRASRMLAVFCAAFDKYIVDGIFTELTSQTIKAASFVFTRMQNGLVHAYGAVMAVGLLAMAFHAVVPHPKVRVIGEQTGRKVQLEASNGLSYEFRWDYDGDGTFDTDWSTEPKVEHEYAEADFKRFAVVFESASFGARPETIVLTPGKSLELSKGDLGASWQLDKGGATPVVVADEHGVIVHPKGARVRKDGALQAAESDVHVGIGEHVSIGEARLSVTGFMRPRLQVRNAFGMSRVGRVNVVVPPVAPRMTAEVAALGGGAP
jgi:NADH-quinone oxidoreductase subunit L